jgi:hypothetical protein
MTSSPGFLTLQLKITPDEDTRLECRNVGSWIQFDRALYSFIETRVASENMIDIPSVNEQMLNLLHVDSVTFKTRLNEFPVEIKVI